MGTTLPTRQEVDRADVLEFDQPRQSRQANITIEITPAGLTIRAEYTGALSSIPAALSSIPAAIEKLRADGVLELVSASRPAAAAAPVSHTEKPAAPKGKAARVQPEYNAAGEACCPKHHKVLREGQWGLYCPAKDDSAERGYCGLKFAE